MSAHELAIKSLAFGKYSDEQRKAIKNILDINQELLEALNGLVDLLEFEKHATRPQIEKAKQLIAKSEGQPSV